MKNILFYIKEIHYKYPTYSYPQQHTNPCFHILILKIVLYRTTPTPKPKYLMKAGVQVNENVKIASEKSQEKVEKSTESDKITTLIIPNINDKPVIKDTVPQTAVKVVSPSLVDITKNLLKSEQDFSSILKVKTVKPQPTTTTTTIIKNNEVTTKAKIIDAVPKNPLKSVANVLQTSLTSSISPVSVPMTVPATVTVAMPQNSSNTNNNNNDEIERIILGVETKTTNHKEAEVVGAEKMTGQKNEPSFNDLKNNKSKDSTKIIEESNQEKCGHELQSNVVFDVAAKATATIAASEAGESNDNQIIKKCENVIQSVSGLDFDQQQHHQKHLDHQCDNGDKVNEKELIGAIFEIKSGEFFFVFY